MAAPIAATPAVARLPVCAVLAVPLVAVPLALDLPHEHAAQDDAQDLGNGDGDHDGA